MSPDELDAAATNVGEPAISPAASTVRSHFHESRTPLSREQLLERRIGDLKLQLDDAPIGRLARRLYDELAAAGLVQFRPPVYLSDDWGCPDRIPIIGVPFYLADEQLTRLADELLEGVDAESDDEIMLYLRHEAGHALNYAHRLYDWPEWTSMFGPFLRPYSDDYTPNPFSRSFVRHLPAWYAQKHPDEDFAETFAVWLDPQSNWREVYADWPCLQKLHFVDELPRRIGSQPPPVTAENYDTQEEFLLCTIAEHYSRLAPVRVDIPRAFDAALRDIFPTPENLEAARPAIDLFRTHRRMIIGSVFYWTGVSEELVRALFEHLQERTEELQLQTGADGSDQLIDLVTLITALCMNRLRTGDFVQK